MLSALTEAERDHYEWLIRGLLTGARRLVGVPGAERTLVQTLETVEELFLEVTFLAEMTPRNIDGEARRLEESLIEELVAAADYYPASSRSSARTASPAR